MTDTAVQPSLLMDADEARLLTDTARKLMLAAHSSMEAAASVVGEVHRRHGWRALGYSSFERYVHDELGMSRANAYRLLDQHRAAELLGVPPGEVSQREAADLLRPDKPDPDPLLGPWPEPVSKEETGNSDEPERPKLPDRPGFDTDQSVLQPMLALLRLPPERVVPGIGADRARTLLREIDAWLIEARRGLPT